jgi:predicted nucleotidyltransferase
MNLEQLQNSDNIIFEAVAGSTCYNLNTPQSDIDLRGVFILPKEMYFGLNDPIDQISDKTNDIMYYELRKFMKLASGCNPNIIELLWIADQHVNITRGPMQKILDNRDMFISKKCFHTFTGYAHTQISKAKGRNKWINNPQPEKAPEAKDYLYWVGRSNMYVDAYHTDPVFRPTLMESTKGYKLAKIEHGFNSYRVYSTDESHDFMSSGRPKCTSITFEEELNNFRGVVVFNDVQYDNDKSSHKNYWEWVANRNDARWVSQERGEIDYDAKNMMHCLRLIMSTRSILTTGEPQVRFEGEEKQFLMDVRNGKFEYDYLMEKCESELVELKELKETSTIPDKVNTKAINRLYQDIMNEHGN